MNKNGFTTPPEHIGFLAKKLFGYEGEIIDGSIAYMEKNGGGPEKPHTHPDHDHLFIVVSGMAKIICGNEEHILSANEVFRVKGEMPHQVWNYADGQTIMLGLTIKG